MRRFPARHRLRRRRWQAGNPTRATKILQGESRSEAEIPLDSGATDPTGRSLLGSLASKRGCQNSPYSHRMVQGFGGKAYIVLTSDSISYDENRVVNRHKHNCAGHSPLGTARALHPDQLERLACRLESLATGSSKLG